MKPPKSLQIFTLRRRDRWNWILYSPTGIQIGDWRRFNDEEEAHDFVRAFASSWIGCSSRLEDENGNEIRIRRTLQEAGE